MPTPLDDLPHPSLGPTNNIGQQPVADRGLIDRLVALAEEGLASGIDDEFDIDAFVENARAINL